MRPIKRLLESFEKNIMRFRAPMTLDRSHFQALIGALCIGDNTVARRQKDYISPRLKEKVFKRDNHTCRYCGTTEGSFHCDHVYPESQGGKTVLGNLVTACARCNHKKHAKIGIWPLPLEIAKEVGEGQRRLAKQADRLNRELAESDRRISLLQEQTNELSRQVAILTSEHSQEIEAMSRDWNDRIKSIQVSISPLVVYSLTFMSVILFTSFLLSPKVEFFANLNSETLLTLVVIGAFVESFCMGCMFAWRLHRYMALHTLTGHKFNFWRFIVGYFRGGTHSDLAWEISITEQP